MSEGKLISVVDANGKRVELYDTGVAKEVFVDGIQGLMAGNGSVKWNFFTTVFKQEYDNIEKEYREVATRIVTTNETFLSIVDFLNEVAADMRKADSGEDANSDQKER